MARVIEIICQLQADIIQGMHPSDPLSFSCVDEAIGKPAIVYINIELCHNLPDRQWMD